MAPACRRAVVAALVLGILIPGFARAMCLPATDAERLAAADAVFEGIVVRGPDSPARLKVLRYIKGSGPKELSVETGSVGNRDGTMTSTSVGITPRRGETWLIYGLGTRKGAVITSSCAGSRRLIAIEQGQNDRAKHLYDSAPTPLQASGRFVEQRGTR